MWLHFCCHCGYLLDDLFVCSYQLSSIVSLNRDVKFPFELVSFQQTLYSTGYELSSIDKHCLYVIFKTRALVT